MSRRGAEFAAKTKFADSTNHFKHETLVKHNNSIEHKLCQDRCNNGAAARKKNLKSAEEAEEVSSTAVPGNI